MWIKRGGGEPMEEKKIKNGSDHIGKKNKI